MLIVFRHACDPSRAVLIATRRDRKERLSKAVTLPPFEPASSFDHHDCPMFLDAGQAAKDVHSEETLARTLAPGARTVCAAARGRQSLRASG